jgi:hypothetical protein
MRNTMYSNGEKVTRMNKQDEPWYSDYQNVMELACRSGTDDIGELFELCHEEMPNLDKERLLRWCVLHTERNRQFYADKVLNHS